MAHSQAIFQAVVRPGLQLKHKIFASKKIIREVRKKSLGSIFIAFA
jgi:hypothetical protein